MADDKIASELERYASGTHELGHDVIACCLKYDDPHKHEIGSLIVKIVRDKNIDHVFRNPVSQLSSTNAHAVNYLSITTVPNRSVARLMESLSESREKAAAFLIASLPVAPSRMMTTHLCWVNLSGDDCAVNDMIFRLMGEWNNRRRRSK